MSPRGNTEFKIHTHFRGYGGKIKEGALRIVIASTA